MGHAPVSIGVVPDALAERTIGRPFAYLITVGPEGAPHLLAVRVEVRGSAVRCASVGSTGRGNVERTTRATLLWPPIDATVNSRDEHRAYSLIADGTAGLEGEIVVVNVERAVLHRPA